MENKKKKLLTILVIIFIILVALFAIRSCTKEKNYEITKEIKNSFINANIEFNCILQDDRYLLNNKAKADALLTQSYQKHGLPIQDNDTMLEILKKYEYDLEVTETIKSFKEKCENGIPTEYYSQ